MSEEWRNDAIMLSEVENRHLVLLEKLMQLPQSQQIHLETIVDGLGEGKSKKQRIAAKNTVMTILGLTPQDMSLLKQLKQLPAEQQEDLRQFVREQVNAEPELESLAPSPVGTPSESAILSASDELSEAPQPEAGLGALETDISVPQTNKAQEKPPSLASLDVPTAGTIPLPTPVSSKPVLVEPEPPSQEESDIGDTKEVEVAPTYVSIQKGLQDPIATAESSSEIEVPPPQELDTEQQEKTPSSTSKSPVTEEVELSSLPTKSENTEDSKQGAAANTVTTDSASSIILQETETLNESEHENAFNASDILEATALETSENTIRFSNLGNSLVISSQEPIAELQKVMQAYLDLEFRSVFGLLKAIDKNALETVDRSKIHVLVENGAVINEIKYPVVFEEK